MKRSETVPQVAPPAVSETKQVPGKPPVVVKPPVTAPNKPPPAPTTIGGSPVEIDLGDDGKKKVPRP